MFKKFFFTIALFFVFVSSSFAQQLIINLGGGGNMPPQQQVRCNSGGFQPTVDMCRQQDAMRQGQGGGMSQIIFNGSQHPQLVRPYGPPQGTVMPGQMVGYGQPQQIGTLQTFGPTQMAGNRQTEGAPILVGYRCNGGNRNGQMVKDANDCLR